MLEIGLEIFAYVVDKRSDDRALLTNTCDK